MIHSYTSGVGFVLKANPDYYFEEKMPHIETFNFNIIKDDNTRLLALLNGDIDGYQFSAVETFYNLQESGYDGTLIRNYGNANPFFFNAKTVPSLRSLKSAKREPFHRPRRNQPAMYVTCLKQKA